MTTDQMRNRTKTVTRRLGWKYLKAGTILNACVKCMGLKPGEKIDRICQIRVTNVRREILDNMERDGKYGSDEARKEGFPGMSGFQFVDMFCRHMRCKPSQVVTRIEFEYVGSDVEFVDSKDISREYTLRPGTISTDDLSPQG